MASERLSTINFLTPIQERIQQVEELMRAQAEGQHSALGAALGHLLVSGGKRIRPAVALLTGGLLGGDPAKLIILGASIEMLHTATLVHDDLIDGSLLRRGIATLNAQWSPAATVLTGDYIFARAAKLAAETDSVAVMRLFADTLAIIVNGEITQLFASHGASSRDDYYTRIYAKTASMFELATTAAALLSPVSNEQVEVMRKFGYQLGMAFQIVDDVLDFTGEQATVGKPVANDLRQGLITLPTIYYMEDHPEDADLKAILAGGWTDEVRFDRLLPAIRRSGAIQRALDDARGFIDSGLETLSSQPDSPERTALEDLGLYVVQRHL